MKSLIRPDSRATFLFGLCRSAMDFARNALGCSAVIPGKEGFEEFCSGEWMHFTHYKKINKKAPELSPIEALPEMIEYMELCKQDIVLHAQALDNSIRRLKKMQLQCEKVSQSKEESK